MIKSFLLLSIAIFLASMGFSQSNIVLDTGKMILKYEDGSIFRGHLFRGDGLNWPMLLSTGDTIRISVFKVEEYLLDDEVYFFRKDKYQLKKGYFANFSWSFGGGYLNITSQVDLTFGWTHSSRLFLGAGFGGGYSDMYLSSQWIDHEYWMPYLYGRYHLNDNRVRFFLEGKAGMAFLTSSSGTYSGGPYLHPAFGISFASNSRFKWHIAGSQFLVNVKGSFEGWDSMGNQNVTYKYNVWYNRTLFQIGLSYIITKSQLRKNFF